MLYEISVKSLRTHRIHSFGFHADSKEDAETKAKEVATFNMYQIDKHQPEEWEIVEVKSA
ncbi:hypothetical protein K9N68_33835 [Kovacikia minuta CCNUW1]|uniref:hypothetical protein n=1 Tax=Kovacikia minuta TaxID=2931930 RepID=UPI001CCDFA39|nr:hypothetical protein [Kovacikia minuta]UBF26424.1 hypothetical protein K9N68_33835 [Kovacikia minuta CCNUW1]